jgi:hypothetical protein
MGDSLMSTRSGRSGTKSSLIKTFTYFIPAPPARKSGYRETEFDKIMQGILTSGFELLELHTESVPTGIFLIALLKAKDKKIFNKDSALDLHDSFKLSHSHSHPDIILEEEEDA